MKASTIALILYCCFWQAFSAAEPHLQEQVPPKIGRPVKISTIPIGYGGNHEVKLKLALEQLELAGHQKVDIACLPESFAGTKHEAIDGPTVKAVAELAKKYAMYVICPISELSADGKKYNTAVLLDRQGSTVGFYRKVYVFWNEGNHCSSEGVKLFDTDFGRIAILTCFDANFDELWQQASRGGAEIVFWPSAYAGGMPLHGYAMIHNYNIVAVGAGNVIDIFGKEVVAEAKPSKHQAIASIDLDVTIIHQDFTGAKVQKLLKDSQGSVERVPSIGKAENWHVLRATKPGTKVRELCEQYGIETLAEYRAKSRTELLERMENNQLINLPRKLERQPRPIIKTSLAAPPLKDWILTAVPGVWEETAEETAGYDGFAWYRAWVKLPNAWKGETVSLQTDSIDDAYELYFNGEKVGGAGTLPPNFTTGSAQKKTLELPASSLRFDEWSLVAIRVYDDGGRGGFKGKAPLLRAKQQQLELAGKWQFRTGDDLAWAKPIEPAQQEAQFQLVTSSKSQVTPSSSQPAKFELPDDLEMQLVLSEPTISQPLHISFDERGRLWLVEFRQYPNPAGLKIVSRDNFWRNIYDKVPPAPPNHFRGDDRVSIHEDTDGDGKFDKHQVFVDGLSLVSSVAHDRDGVWVLNPPYLLFYPDRNHDDVPDGDPELHLSGFGIEDSHAIANSLRFGPDGWLYGAQGSTVTSTIRRTNLDSNDKPGIAANAQLLWRYHPQSRRFEVFAEGGGNAFGLEIDAQGRMFSGHNGGDTRGFHYLQGAYLQKGFNKHGPLSNPYAFGYFPAIKHDRVPRFTHEFIIYEQGALPEKYNGRMFAISPILGYMSLTAVEPRGSTFETRDLSLITSDDKWFRPVDISMGPEGSIYVADWHDSQTNHYRNHEGEIDKKSGRIYRLQKKGQQPSPPINYGKLSIPDLVDQLQNKNIWVRQTALRLLQDRQDTAALPLLQQKLEQGTAEHHVDHLWALYQLGGLNDSQAIKLLSHKDLFVRTWTVRLLGDEGKISDELLPALVQLAQAEPNVEVRAQLACTAKRFPQPAALAMVRELVKHEADTEDPQIPLLIWWAIEAQCSIDPTAVLKLFAEPEFQQSKLVKEFLLSRVMQRYAATGKRADLLHCATLLAALPADLSEQCLTGFEAAYRGRTPTNLPSELLRGLAKTGKAGLALRVRLEEPEAIREALTVMTDKASSLEKATELATILGEIRAEAAIPALLKLAIDNQRPKMQRVAIISLGAFSDEKIPSALIENYSNYTADLQPLVQNLLAGRSAWAKTLLDAVKQRKVAAHEIPKPIISKLLVYHSPEIDKSVNELWGDELAKNIDNAKTEQARLLKIIEAGNGSPYAGKKLFSATCAKCHTLFSEGGQVGPDLTAYNRENLSNMLQHIVTPSAEIREGFETYAITTADGRAFTGFLADQDTQVIVLRGYNGENTTLPRENIDEMRNTGTSLMPEGLLKDFTEKQVRDLFAYLRSTQPLNN
jgi:putative membrane-bound dehydrogenase-like protein